MWTPRRVVILSGCFVALFLVYFGYSFSKVGRIDGLPPLPQAYWPGGDSDNPVQMPPRSASRLEARLRLAFGENCKEQKWAIGLDLSRKNMALAAEKFHLTPDGRVCLAPLSIALFGKERKDGQPPEINTIRGEVAYLTFDRPVHSPSEINGRKIVEAELTGRIEIASNRRRPERDQDLRVEIHTGPLYYHEPTHRIRTDDYVTLTDHKGSPKPHVLKGKGLEMELETEPAQPGKKKPGPGGLESVTGVKWVELRSAVHLTLHTDGRSANLVGKPASAEKDKKAPPERATLEITTPGRFRYELYKDHDLAHFEAGVTPAGQTPRMPPQVKARRENLTTGKNDLLVCHKLTLRLRRREAKDRPAADGVSPEAIDVQSVRATAPGRNVVLTSDAEGLEVTGSELYHDARAGRTEVKCAEGLHVHRRDSDIHARELEIQDIKPPAIPGQPPPRPYQNIRAVGPGKITVFDAREKKTVRAEWQKLLTSAREGSQDVLTLTGAAEFHDPSGGQTLRGDTLKVWLEEVAASAAGAETRAAAAPASRRPSHLEATGRVSANSREINVNDANRLVVWFKDAPGAARLPAPAAPAAPAAKPAPAITGPLLGPASEAGENRPFDLTAKKVHVWVTRTPARNQVDKLECQGSVHVAQRKAPNQARGTEVKGDSLRMAAKGEGLYELIVTGDLGELQTETIYIAGPEVHIDQATNEAWVVGDGVMTMESKTNWQGDELAKAQPLTVHWSKSMLFNGDSAEFHGNIQAEQDRGRLGCQTLQVYFDRTVSLRRQDPAKAKEPPARVRNMVCSRDVRIEESQYAGQRLLRYQRLEGPAVSVEALEPDDPRAKAKAGNKLVASGPGNIRIWEESGGDLLLAPGPGERSVANKPGPKSGPKPAAPARKVTYVAFGRQMVGNSHSGKATFYDGVRVLNMPLETHDGPIELDLILEGNLPEGAIYIKCDKLEVLDRKVDGVPVKEMKATGKVFVQGREFWARAEEASFHQGKQQVVLDGKDGLAELHRATASGGETQKSVGQKLIYNRTNGEVYLNGVLMLRGQGGAAIKPKP